MSDVRKAFLDVIAADRYDQTTRLVYADWLEEQGLDDEALEQRRWTPERQHAEDWIGEFAERIGQTRESLMAAADRWVRQSDYTYDNDENYKGHWNEFEAFWAHYETLTGAKVDDRDCPFTCSC